RRRHTRFSRDWSSDVCSSDLAHLDVEVDYPLDSDEYLHASAFITSMTAAWRGPSTGSTAKNTRDALPRQSIQQCMFRSRTGWKRSEERRVGKECRSWRVA